MAEALSYNDLNLSVNDKYAGKRVAHVFDSGAGRYAWVSDGSASTLTLAKNTADFTPIPVELEYYNDDVSSGVDGKYYPTLDPAGAYVLPDITNNNGRRVILATDWAARMATVPTPTWVTHAATNATFNLPPTGFPAEGNALIHMIADVANNQWVVRTQGDVTIDQIVPTFDNDIDAIAGTVPGSLYQGSGLGDIPDGLFRVKADNTRIAV